MKYDHHLITKEWAEYELLDSGENSKLERFGEVILARPETEALWKKMQPQLWERAHAEFAFEGSKGMWKIHGSVPDSWNMTWGDARAILKLTNFKHTGIFPEQVPNWEWTHSHIKKLENPQVLNLFGYTGIASIIAAQAGAFVTHVDASKQSLDWAHENARLSGLGEDRIRWIFDDALAFARREVRRGAIYDGIILDPPAFGRGAKGEVWKIEDTLSELLEQLQLLLSKKSGALFLLNGYAAGYSPLSFVQALESIFGTMEGESGELRLEESSTHRAIPAGIYVRFVR
jgi:23S rRNA (cytosine1962-C5)-methyltransferase